MAKSSNNTEETHSVLQEEFQRIEYDTLDGDTCYAKITSIDRLRGDISIAVELPSGRTHTEIFDYPEVATNRYEFVRLLHSIGYGLSSVDHAVGSDVRVRITDNGPMIIVPEQSVPLSERVRRIVPSEFVLAAGVVTVTLSLPVSAWVLFPRWYDSRYSLTMDWIERVGFWFIATVVWVMCIGIPALVLWGQISIAL